MTLSVRPVHLVIAGSLFFLAAQVAPQAQTTRDAAITSYIIVSGDSSNMSGSWNTSDQPRLSQLKSQYGSHFAWFRLDGNEYVITIQSTLDDIDDAMVPQRAVNQQQGGVNAHQAAVNRMQAVVNAHQRDVNRAQSEVNRQQSLVNQHAGSQSDVNRMQSEVNAKQHEVNAEQKDVNREQDVVNMEQSVVNDAQKRAAAQVRAALRGIFESARMHGLAHQVR